MNKIILFTAFCCLSLTSLNLFAEERDALPGDTAVSEAQALCYGQGCPNSGMQVSGAEGRQDNIHMVRPEQIFADENPPAKTTEPKEKH